VVSGAAIVVSRDRNCNAEDSAYPVLSEPAAFKLFIELFGQVTDLQ